jgi:hypothetical protein
VLVVDRYFLYCRNLVANIGIAILFRLPTREAKVEKVKHATIRGDAQDNVLASIVCITTNLDVNKGHRSLVEANIVLLEIIVAKTVLLFQWPQRIKVDLSQCIDNSCVSLVL